MRGKVPFQGALMGPAGESGEAGAEGPEGPPGEDGNIVDVVTPGTFDPDDYNPGDVVFFVDALDEPTLLTFGGQKGDGAGGGFPEELPVVVP